MLVRLLDEHSFSRLRVGVQRTLIPARVFVLPNLTARIWSVFNVPLNACVCEEISVTK